ncbi:MAG: ATP-dependent RecD-like DNA helicase [Bacillota bacterium]|jgi:exodeoxyribonuclease V alpha subunit|nr:ATP-dependent RecD-like DNA helicase [Bacillota bacterium]NLL26916.1 ATP-dependent RecD-like DNA helicase [Erysipelotrichia bacterium]
MEEKGRFIKEIFRNQQNGYTVAVFELEESKVHQEITVVGYIGEIDKNARYSLQGDYVENPRYGIQFKMESYKKLMADNKEGMIKYFSGVQFKGIGPVFAERLVNSLGLDAIEKIKNNTDILDEVPSMTTRRKKAILEGLKQEADEAVIFLTSHHISLKNVFKLKHKYGNDLLEIMKTDPYRVIREVEGIGFATVDKFALDVGFEKDDINRLTAYSESLLMSLCMKNGDTYLELNEFIKHLNKNIGQYVTDVYKIVERLVMYRLAYVEEDRIYHISQYDAEVYIAKYLALFPEQHLKDVDAITAGNAISTVQDNLSITYDQDQLQAIMSFYENDLMIVTGGPGTGKTTIVKAMIKTSELLYPDYNINLVAPTGRAAKRLTELTDCEAKTIHSLLLWDKETGRFAKDENDPLSVDILIVDEFSMVDQYLFYNLLKACASLKKLVIIGDVDQLPSVAMGSVLKDLIESELFEVIELDKIYRQKEGSDIIYLAKDIKNEEVIEIPTDNEIRFFECEKTDIKDITLQIVEHALNKYETLEEGFMNVQVLAPKHKGVNGIENLNVALQKKFNPYSKNKRQLQVGYKTFRLGDKVLQLKNQPDDDVYNGDIGIITEIIFASEDYNNQNRIIADFDGRIVEYTYDTFSNLAHAYCMSVHKSQGSEYPIIILPMSLEYSIMLQKRLIYTAVTRAYKSLIFVGQKEAFFKGIAGKEMSLRKTTLKQRLIAEVDFYEQR